MNGGLGRAVVLVILGAAMLTTACGRGKGARASPETLPTPVSWSQVEMGGVRLGMTPEELQAALIVKPRRKVASAQGETWEFPQGSGIDQVGFRRGHVAMASGRRLDYQGYKIVSVEGTPMARVTQWLGTPARTEHQDDGTVLCAWISSFSGVFISFRSGHAVGVQLRRI